MHFGVQRIKFWTYLWVLYIMKKKEHQPAVICNIYAMGFLLGTVFFL